MNTISSLDLNRNFGSVPKVKQMTVDKLLANNELTALSKTERDRVNPKSRIKLNR